MPKKKKVIPDDEKITVEEFVNACFQCSNKPKRTHKGIIYLYGIVFLGHLYLDEYKQDIFNSHFPLIVIDTNKNIIKIWTSYGSKVEIKNEYKYDFGKVDPKFVVEGLLRPED